MSIVRLPQSNQNYTKWIVKYIVLKITRYHILETISQTSVDLIEIVVLFQQRVENRF